MNQHTKGLVFYQSDFTLPQSSLIYMRLTATQHFFTEEYGGQIIRFLEKELSPINRILKVLLLKKNLNPGKKCKWFDGAYLLIPFEEFFYKLFQRNEQVLFLMSEVQL